MTACILSISDQASCEGDHVASHGPIGIEGDFARFRGRTEAPEIREDYACICSEERWDDSRAPFGRRIRQGRSSAKSLDEKSLPFFKDRQNPLETSKLSKPINPVAMQKNDGRTFSFIMEGDGGAVE